VVARACRVLHKWLAWCSTLGKKRLMPVADWSRADNFGDLLHFFSARSFVDLSTLLRSRRPAAATAQSARQQVRQTGPILHTRAFTLKENSCGVA
jgi:hypothetical protein